MPLNRIHPFSQQPSSPLSSSLQRYRVSTTDFKANSNNEPPLELSHFDTTTPAQQPPSTFDEFQQVDHHSNSFKRTIFSIRFCLITLISCLILLSVVALSITWASSFGPTVTELSHSARDAKLEKVIQFVELTFSKIVMTSETVKQFLVGDGLDMSNFPALQQKIYSAYKSSQKVHSDMVMACYVGDTFQNMLGVGRLTLMTPLATFNLTSQFTKVFMCQGNFTQLDSCIINSTNPNIVAPPNDNSLKIKTCNQNSGKVVFTPSYVKAGMEDVIFISMLNCIPSRNVSAQEDENGNRFSYYYGYDLTSDSVSRFLKREFQSMVGYRVFIIETTTNYLLATDNDVKIFQSRKDKIIRSTYETVNDTEIVAIAKTAFTNLATSPQNLVCNKILLTSNANSYILLYRLCTETKIDWIFVLAVPQWTYISSTLIAVLVAVSGSLLIVTVGIIFGILFSVRIVQPFHQLIESFESVGQMDLDSLFIQKSSFSEVRELQKQFQFMVNRMKLYKSFIPSHLLSEIENGGEHDVKDDAGYHLVNVAASSSSQRTKGSCESFSKKSSNYSTQNMGSASLRRKYVQKDNKFQLYLEKRRITLVEILLEGLNDWLSILTPNETVMLLSDIFEQVNSICRSSGSSQISSLENDSLIIAFNATRNQNKHEEKAAHFCQVLNEKLLGVKYMKWKRIISHSNLVNETSSNSLQSSKKFQPLNICDLMRFRFAITTCDSFCGNVGSQEMKQFSVLSSGKYNLSTMMEVAKKLNVNIVCSESVKRVCEKSFCMRYVDTQNLTDDSYVASYGNIGEDLSKLIPQTATHIYQLGQVLQVNQDEWMYELFEKEKMNEWNTYNQACQLYFERNYAQALEMFQEFSAKNSQDKPTEQMIQRCTLSL